MGGGLLNIISYGNQNIMLNGNPSKTFFKTVYAKYTNFGMQKFRIDYEGQRNLKLNEDTHLTFKIPRQGELFMDAYMVINLPDIWSPILPPLSDTDCWKPYQFRWISHIGANMIRRARVVIGGQTIQEFSGEYLKNMVDRDFNADKKDFFYKMIGHEDPLYRPEYAYNRVDRYPNSFYLEGESVEPSLRGRTLYVPLHFWFMNSAKMALPLVSLQYQELHIVLELRPIRELFTICDVSLTKEQGFSFNPIQPNFANEYHSLYRFLQPPPNTTLESTSYGNKPTTWDSDIHLMTTYAFLTDEESRIFAANEQRYLIKDIHESLHTNIVGNKRVRIDSNAMVSSWMWNFRRNDAYQRNEWSNYSNWDYQRTLPNDLTPAPEVSVFSLNGEPYGPGANPAYSLTGNIVKSSTSYYVNPILSNRNIQQILLSMSILFDGKFREFSFSPGVYNYIEKYRNSNSVSNDGLYSYSFSLNTSPFEMQPSGAINMSRFKTIELDISTIIPDIDPNASFQVICDTEGTIIGTTQKDILYVYTYDFYLAEERYNLLRFISGNAALLYAR
jgi:hypothetical protein